MAKTTAGHEVADVVREMGVRTVKGIVGSFMKEIIDGMYQL